MKWMEEVEEEKAKRTGFGKEGAASRDVGYNISREVEERGR